MPQRLDEAKRREIMGVAARLFASRPFHEVKLDDVAAEARVGKGTLYGYFTSKEDLHLSLIVDGFERLSADLHAALDAAPPSAWERLRLVVINLVGFGRRSSCVLRLMRNAIQAGDHRLDAPRRELAALIESVIVAGVQRAEFVDANPTLTAQYILACVRGVHLYGPPGLSEEDQVAHLLSIIGAGLRAPTKPTRRGTRTSGSTNS